MFNEIIDKLLADRKVHPPAVHVGKSLKYDIDELLLGQFAGASYAIVDDKFTSEIFGDHIFKALTGKASCTHVTLPHPANADMATVQWLRGRTQSADIIVAVGSGTVNDLCKYASAQDGKPYVVFPTAASMNGYLSANASISVEGHKTTLPAQMPQAVYCDMSIIAGAPERLGKSGLGDSLARPTAQADWLLSHLLLGTDYDATPFELLAPLEKELHDNARGIGLRDPHALELLMNTLLLSGLGMTLAGGSYPASQGEHMVAHSYEMLQGKPPSAPTLHGEEIGLTTLYMAHLQEKLLRSKPAIVATAFDQRALAERFGAHLAGEFKVPYTKKYEAMLAANLRDLSASKWDECIERISPLYMPPSAIEKLLEQAACPTSPKSLGWDTACFTYTCNNARFTRERFTFLDL